MQFNLMQQQNTVQQFYIGVSRGTPIRFNRNPYRIQQVFLYDSTGIPIRFNRNSYRIRLFADDTNLTASGQAITQLEAAVNSDLENLRKWLIANKLSLNVAKTEFILIGSKPMIKSISYSHLSIKIDNKPIKQIHECKSLGVIIDQHVSWNSNTDNICKKSNSPNFCSSAVKRFC